MSDPAPPRLKGWSLFLAALSVVLLVQTLFVTSYVGALHAPKPHNLRLAVVGTSPLPRAVGTQFSLKLIPYADEQAARDAIDERDVVAAFVSGPEGPKLIVAPAGGPPLATAVTNAFGVGAAALKQKLEVEQVHLLPSGDTTGGVSFFVTMALVVGGYLASTVAMLFGGAATRHGRLAALAGASVVGALLTYAIAGVGYGALPGDKFLALWGIFALVMAAVAFMTAALQTLFGAAGTLIVVVSFVIFGAPSAGGAVPSPFLPSLWRTIGPFLPAGAGTTATRNTLYFDGNGIGRSLLVLAAYLIVGALVVIAIRRKSTGLSEEEAEASEAAAGAVIVV